MVVNSQDQWRVMPEFQPSTNEPNEDCDSVRWLQGAIKERITNVSNEEREKLMRSFKGRWSLSAVLIASMQGYCTLLRSSRIMSVGI